jgi:lipopolysaccharide biosynthesis regulator YciM
VLDGLRRARTRLGDLYMTDENYEKCVEYYQSVIDSEAEREGFESSRLISNLYYLIGSCYLYDNKTGCEAKAIS